MMERSNRLTPALLLQGFTLVELSVVLVIIGLVLGAIFVGRDLIRHYELRRVVTDLQAYITAVNTFRIEYNCQPGDCPTATTLFPSAKNIYDGNGNGVIEYDSGIPMEGISIWQHLSEAGLIAGNYVGVTPSSHMSNQSCLLGMSWIIVAAFNTADPRAEQPLLTPAEAQSLNSKLEQTNSACSARPN